MPPKETSLAEAPVATEKEVRRGPGSVQLLLIEADPEETGESDRKMTLWDLDTQLEAIADALETLEGEEADEQIRAAVEAYFGECVEARNEKLESYARLIAFKENSAEQREVRAKLYKREAERLAKLAKADESLVKKLKNRLLQYFVAKGLKKVETRNNVFNRQNNGGERALVFAPGASSNTAADRFVVTTREWNQEAIRAAIAAGETLDFVTLAPATERVAIR